MLKRTELQSATIAILEECLAANGAPVTHDPDDSRHVAYLEAVARLNGYTPERYPALFRSFNAPRTTEAGAMTGDGAADAFHDGEMIDYLAPLIANGRARSVATITRTPPVHSIFATLSVHNRNADGAVRLLASGAAHVFLQQTMQVATDDTVAEELPATGQNYATLTCSVAYADGTSDAKSVSNPWSYKTTKDPTVSHPVIKPGRTAGDLENIVVGLARGWNNAAQNQDIDYWFWQNQFENTTLLVPFAGSMHFTDEIDDLGPNNPVFEYSLTRKEGGMSTLSNASVDARFHNCFRIDPADPKRLNFSFMPTETAVGTALDFGPSPWVSDTQTFFTGLVTVMFKNGGSGWSTVMSSVHSDVNLTDGVAHIKPIVYVWHCLGEGTRIAIADGSLRKIEELDSGMQVLGPEGSKHTVQATYAAPHYGELYVVKTSGGKSLTCSGSHPISTPDGPVRAADLTVGTTALTIDGSDVVSEVGSRHFDGQGLFNLDLGDAGGSTFYAEGLLVGDHRMQVKMLRTPDPVRDKQRLPEYLHVDYDSHLEDLAKARAQ
ncbi:hypothetical protein [Streptomyces sp. NPDC057429]|uniref:hypothetical protein n=1 Tax=Streptomyces sp. NPDC057429 TaxID=3346130 RepID=UPI003690D561